jgi:16S rRNA (adenine1518-N6/adenine1519-N6)-dimethyltransferase
LFFINQKQIMTTNNQHTHRPKKHWSQNFLRDDNIALKIANSLQLTKPFLIIEIGPGKGILTKYLLDKATKLLAIEIDPILAKNLPKSLNYPANLHIIMQDFIEWDPNDSVGKGSFKNAAVVGNLPYHITSPIIFKVLDYRDRFQQAIFTMQKEVAQRIAASPGSKKYGILSVFCQFYAKVEFLFTIPASVFFPQPQVDSAVIRLSFLPGAEKELLNPLLFKEIVRLTFNQRRKMLRNTLLKLFSETILNKLSLDLKRRPESLSVKEFVDLANQLQSIQMSDKHGTYFNRRRNR